MFKKSIAALILLSAFVATTEAQRYGQRVRLMGARRFHGHNRRLDASTYDVRQEGGSIIAAQTAAAASGNAQVQSSAGAAGAVSQANGLFGSSSNSHYANNSWQNQSALYQAVNNKGDASSNYVVSSGMQTVNAKAAGASLGYGNSGAAATNDGGQAYANGSIGGSSGASYNANMYLNQNANGYAYNNMPYHK